MNLSKLTMESIDALGFVNATEVQEDAIPIILSGKDLIARSQTGTGKTAAFGIGLIEHLLKDKTNKALVLAPTRELALQITKDLRALSFHSRLRIYAIYGGEDINRQFRVLEKGYDIIVATPGRLLDHFNRGSIRLNSIKSVVLDEADRMLDMGFQEDINKILSEIPNQRQTLLFSATISREIMSISAKYMRDPEAIEVGAEERPPEIEEHILEVDMVEKYSKLKQIINAEPDTRMIIFVATQRSAEYIGERLMKEGFNAAYLHGGLTQNKRERIMHSFKEGKFPVLVATDVAARGLHISDVAHVVNYDEAGSRDTHTHRIGRTGRMGKKGKATTFKVVSDSRDRSRPRTQQSSRRSYSGSDSKPRSNYRKSGSFYVR